MQTDAETRLPRFETIAQILIRVLERVKGRGEAPEFPFGIPSLDAVTRGIKRSKLTVIAGRASEGKTSLAMYSAATLASRGKMVAYISLEDDRETLAEKLFCQIAQIENWKLQMGHAELLENTGFDEYFKKVQLLVMDDFGYTIEEIREVIQQLDPKPDVVFLDYVQLIEQKERQSEYEAVSMFVRKIQRLAKQEQIAIVLLSQINRTGATDKRPSLHHLAGCGRLEQCAEMVLLIHAPWYYGMPTWDMSLEEGKVKLNTPPRNYLEIEVAKNKQGKRAVVIPVKFTGDVYHFADWSDYDTELAKFDGEKR